jgi:hypothetical protein
MKTRKPNAAPGSSLYSTLARLDMGRSVYDSEGREIAAQAVPQPARDAAAPTGRVERPAGDVLSAFVRLVDRDNHVSLVALRAACSLSRDAFDRQLRQLRVDGTLTCSDAEGRNGLTAAEREAAIAEGGGLLLYVHRR